MDTGGLGVAFAVLTPVGLLVEAGTESYGHFDFFDADDEFVLRQNYAAFGDAGSVAFVMTFSFFKRQAEA